MFYGFELVQYIIANNLNETKGLSRIDKKTTHDQISLVSLSSDSELEDDKLEIKSNSSGEKGKS